MVTRAHLRYTRDYVMLRIYNLVKSAAMQRIDAISHRVVLYIANNEPF